MLVHHEAVWEDSGILDLGLSVGKVFGGVTMVVLAVEMASNTSCHRECVIRTRVWVGVL